MTALATRLRRSRLILRHVVLLAWLGLLHAILFRLHLLPHPHQLLHQELQDPVLVLWIHLLDFLQLCDLNDVWVLVHALLFKQLTPLID